MAVSQDAQHLEIESWTLFGCTWLFIFARLASRRILLQSWRNLRIDDYLMIFASLTYTGVIVFVNETAQNLDNYLAPGVFETFGPDDIVNAIYGSKCVFITEEFILATLWLCKACLLILYSQLTKGVPKQHKLVKWVGAYCVLGYIVTQILFLGVWCRPIQQYWWVPVQNSQCASYYHHLITASVFNISSDLMMLLIPIPILIKAQLPPKKKAILIGVFSLGAFVILASILNRYYNFTAGYGSLIYLNWYAGEASTAVMVANVPHCWPIISRMFRLGSFKSVNPSGATPGYISGEGGSAPHNKRSRFSSAITSMGTRSNNGYTRDDLDEERDSIEHIVGKGGAPGKNDITATVHPDNGDVELGPLPSSVMHPGHVQKPPEYEANASAGRGPGGFWLPERVGHRSEERVNEGDGVIVKTVHMDQRYEN